MGSVRSHPTLGAADGMAPRDVPGTGCGRQREWLHRDALECHQIIMQTRHDTKAIENEHAGDLARVAPRHTAA